MEKTSKGPGTPTSVASVEVIRDAVVPPNVTVYAVELACGCTSTVFDPPERPPFVGASALCYSVDGSHLRVGRISRGRLVAMRLGLTFRRLFYQTR